MECERDTDSNASYLQSSPWWMMRSLWKKEISDERHLQVSVVDSFLVEHGHPVCWYFTSSKTGRVLKRDSKRCEWDEFIGFLGREARERDVKGSTLPGTLAVVWRLVGARPKATILTVSDINRLREKHNAHLLDEIIAIQPYTASQPFSGCGVFETSFVRKGRHRGAQAASMTFEFMRWPEEDRDARDCFQQRLNIERIYVGKAVARRSVDDRSSVRIFGIIHRVLASTTKCIVDHMERETGEPILVAVAQYVFRVGSGQPTLLWIESCETLESFSGGEFGISSHGQGNGYACHPTGTIRHRSGDDRPWTTYFPPGPSALGLRSAKQARSLALNTRSDEESRAAGTANQTTIPMPAKITAECTVEPPPFYDRAGKGNMNGQVMEISTGIKQEGSEASVDQDMMPRKLGAHDITSNVQNMFPLGHFSLPTESWTKRSSRFWRLSEEHEQHDDLERDSSQDCGSRKSRSCYGDFCNYRLNHPSSAHKEDGVENNCDYEGDGDGDDNWLSVHLVPYRSILRCRAEEGVLANRVIDGMVPGCVGLDPWMPKVDVGDGSTLGNVLFKETITTAIANRMKTLASSLNDDGRAEYARLRSSDSKRAGGAETVQRAVEELLYGRISRGMHPSAMDRPVTVCSTCAVVRRVERRSNAMKVTARSWQRRREMVYRHMDQCREDIRYLQRATRVRRLA